MPLHQLYNLSTGTLNPSYLTGLLAGGAGAATSGTAVAPGISAPRLEETTIEVLDVTAPTLLAAAGTANAGIQLCLPAAAGKYLVMSPITGAFGARWKLQGPTPKQAIPRGTGGVVFTAGAAQVANQNVDAGYAVSTAAGNEAQFGTKAVVMYDGPIQAFVETTVGGSAISAGMYLTPDGAGNLTYAGASPGAGTVVAIYCGANIAASVSIPVLSNVYMGSF